MAASLLIMNFGHTPSMLVCIRFGWVNQTDDTILYPAIQYNTREHHGWVNQADMWNLSRNFINGSQQKTPQAGWSMSGLSYDTNENFAK